MLQIEDSSLPAAAWWCTRSQHRLYYIA